MKSQLLTMTIQECHFKFKYAIAIKNTLAIFLLAFYD